MKTLTENTLVPLSMAVAVIGGGAAWLTAMHLKASAAELRASTLETRISEVEKIQQLILQSLARIEGRLGTAPKTER